MIKNDESSHTVDMSKQTEFPTKYSEIIQLWYRQMRWLVSLPAQVDNRDYLSHIN